jgi:hypothetical protein
MSRLVVLPPEHGASAYLNIRCRDERSGRESKMGVRASPVRGRVGAALKPRWRVFPLTRRHP